MHGGVLRGPAPTGGAAGRFPQGTTFATEPGFPSRANSSWYFGDGAALFNEVNAQFASRFNIRFPQVVALDSMLNSRAWAGRAAAVGVSASRAASHRGSAPSSASIAVRYGFGSPMSPGRDRSDTNELRARVQRADRHHSADGSASTSTADLDEAVAHHTAITGVLTIGLTKHRRMATHALAGAGRVLNRADPLEARLRGNYQFRFFDTFPVNESDTVTIRFTEHDSATSVSSAAESHPISGNVTGARRPARSRRPQQQRHVRGCIAVRPTSRTVRGLPSNTNPSLQFSTTTTDGSSLNGSTTGLRTLPATVSSCEFVLSVG